LAKAGAAKPRALRAHLNETLFPEAARGTSSLSRWEIGALTASLLALAIVLQLMRLGWSSSLDTLWAEDGSIFLQRAIAEGVGESLFATYAGYLVLVPRLIGEAATLAPLEDAAAAISILSAAVVALSGLVVWFAAAGHIRSPYLRGALAVATVLVPVAGQESVDSAAYVPWYMLFATFWLLLWRPRTLLSAALASLFVLATALSTPGVWFLLPVAVLRAIALRDGRDLAIVGGYAIGAAVQVPVFALNAEEAVEPAWTQDIWTALLQRVLDGAALGLRLGGVAWSHLGWALLVALGLCAIAGLAVGLKRSDATARWLVAICVPTSVALFVVSVYQRAVGTQIVWPEGNYNWAAGRYAIVPVLLAISAGLVLVDRSSASGRGNRRAWPAIVAVTAIAISVAGSFDMRSSARETPTWRDTLAGAAATCAAERSTGVLVPITPEGWTVELPCDQVTDAAGESRAGP
jgi:hypothetical protein